MVLACSVNWLAEKAWLAERSMLEAVSAAIAFTQLRRPVFDFAGALTPSGRLLSCHVQRSRVQLSLVAGLIAVGLCAVVGIMVVQKSSAPQQDVLVQTVARIHAKGGRLTLLDDEVDTGSVRCTL